MLEQIKPTFLLASHEPALLASLEPLLAAQAAQVEIALSAEAAQAALAAAFPPSLALLDADLPGIPIAQLLKAARMRVGGRRTAVVLISDNVTDEWLALLADGTIEDVIPKATGSPFWRVRVDAVLRVQRMARKLEQLSESAALHAQFDGLTGIYNRETILAMLFRETDRVQRLKNSLGLVLFDVDDFGHWNSRLGAEACDELLCQIAQRTGRLLRSYDLLGRAGKDEFLVAIPGCSRANAVMLAERIRLDAFSVPFHAAGETIRLSACFGVSISDGRSPLVILREAEQALQFARLTGPEKIQCADDCVKSMGAPVTFFAPSTGDELLAW
jgi:diguanylate cyclase (GGDEF)-like protein